MGGSRAADLGVSLARSAVIGWAPRRESIVVCKGVGSALCTAQGASAGYPGQAKIVHKG